MIVTPERAFKILSVMPATERTLTISDRGDRASDFRCLGLQWADIDLKEAYLSNHAPSYDTRRMGKHKLA
jgi:hypothetical protein